MTFDEWWTNYHLHTPALAFVEPLDAVRETAAVAWRAATKAAQPQWRPMETAPKDGTELLLCSRKGRIASGCWSRADHKNKTGFWAWPYINQEPTHWMPTPPAGAAQ